MNSLKKSSHSFKFPIMELSKETKASLALLPYLLPYLSSPQILRHVARENSGERVLWRRIFISRIFPKFLTLLPLLTMRQDLLLKFSHSDLIAFHKPALQSSLTNSYPLEHQSPLSSPNLPTVTRFQRDPLSKVNFQLHLPLGALFKRDKFLMPRAPFLLFEYTIVQLTKWDFLLRAPPPCMKSLWSRFNLKLTFLGTTNKDMK